MSMGHQLSGTSLNTKSSPMNDAWVINVAQYYTPEGNLTEIIEIIPNFDPKAIANSTFQLTPKRDWHHRYDATHKYHINKHKWASLTLLDFGSIS